MKNLIKSLLFVIILMPIASFPDTVAEGKKLTFDRKKGNCPVSYTHLRAHET